MKLQEAVKYINKKAFVGKVAYKLISDWKKIWKPGKKVGLDVERIVTYMQELNPELIKGDLESWGRRQYKDLVKLAIREAYYFSFKDKQQREDFKNNLQKIIKKEGIKFP